MGIVVCTLNTEQDEVLCCPLCSCCHLRTWPRWRCLCCWSRCRCSSCCCLCCSCCCHRSRGPPSWLQCPPPGPTCSPGFCPEACLHPHHQPRHQPRPSCRSCPRPPRCCCRPRCCQCCCCLNICRRAGLRQDNKTFILNLT